MVGKPSIDQLECVIFLLEPTKIVKEGVHHFAINQQTYQAVCATLQAELFVLVKETWGYDVPFPRFHREQTHTHCKHIDMYTNGLWMKSIVSKVQ